MLCRGMAKMGMAVICMGNGSLCLVVLSVGNVLLRLALETHRVAKRRTAFPCTGIASQ